MRIVLSLLLVLLIAGLPLYREFRTQTERRNFREVEAGRMYRSGQMTPEALERVIKEYGIRTVVSFRDNRDPGKPSPDEYEEDLCKQLKVKYIRLSPLRWSQPDGSVPAQQNVEKFLKLVNDPKTPKPILVHCFAGVHRTGAFVALYRMDRCGWSNTEAMAEMFTIAGDRKVYDEDQLEYLRKYKSVK